MKNRGLHIKQLFFAFAAWWLVSCEIKEEPLFFETTAAAAYTFPAAEASATFTVSSNVDWRVEVTEGRDRCTVTPASGTGSATVTVHVAENPVYLQAQAMALRLTAGDYTKDIAVTQAALPCPDFNAGTIAAAGQTVTIGGTPATANSVEEATGGGIISYQWYKNGYVIEGATEAYYTPPPADATTAGAYTYTRRAKDDICNTTLTESVGTWVLTVVCPDFNPGAITATGQTVAVGGTPITIHSEQDATGAGTISYQWYKNGQAISSATAANYTPTNSDASAIGVTIYTRRAKDNVCNTSLTESTGSWVLTVICPFDAGAIATVGQTVAVGGTPNPISSVQNATGNSTISYQWYKNGQAISGATAANYTPPKTDATAVGTNIYTRHAKDNTCNTTLTPAAGSWALMVVCLDFNPGAIATVGQTVAVSGTPVTINSVQDASGGEDISYQWYKNGQAISGATAANYTPPKADATAVGTHTYTRRAKDNSCNTTFTQSTGSWVLNVICPFDAGAIATTGQSIAVGGTPATINSVQNAASNGTISYQWYKNGVAISGATEAYYTPPLTDATVAGTYTYTRRVKDNICNTTLTLSMGSWVLSVICPAFNAGAIATAGQTVTIGGTPVLISNVQNATGNGTISYQWYKNGQAISGATAANYTPPKTDAAVAGVHTYTRYAKDNTCNTTLTPSVGSWVLTVVCSNFDPGAIATAGQTVTVGGTPITINSMQNATGTGTIGYQWYKNGVAISGATEAYYTPPPADATVIGAHTYTRRAKDNTCNTTLTPAEGSWVLTVVCPFDAGAIATEGQTVMAGGTPNPISSVQNATSNSTISYQWYKNGAVISGATAANYTPPKSDASTVAVYTYTRRAKDNTCNTSLTPAVGTWVLTVICPFDAGAIATAGQTVTIGSTPVTINSAQNASGVGVIAYQWYKNGVAISGATAADYTPPVSDATTAGVHTYTRRVRDNLCNTTLTPSEGSWILTVVCPGFNSGAIATAGQTVTVGSTPVTINSTQNASGGGVIAYQWYKNGIAISGATEAYYTPPPTDATVAGVHTYTRRAKDNTCNTTLTPSEGSWILTVVCPDFNPGSITTDGQTVLMGSTPVTINSAQNASGGGAISYQWYKNGNAISGATAANYTPPKSDASTIGVYTYTRRAKDNTCNTTLTLSAGSWVLTVICPFDAGAIATAGQTVTIGSTPVMINSAQNASGGGVIAYQWYKNGNAISGATAANYTPPVSDATTTGVHTYTRRVRDNICNTTLTPSEGSWVLTVVCPDFNPGAIATTGQTVTVGGTPITINSEQNATGAGAIGYQWYKNGVVISGATEAYYTPPKSEATVASVYTYTRRAKDNTCNTTLTPSEGSWVLTVVCPDFDPGAIATTGQTVTVSGTPITINSAQAATGGDGNITYQWYKNGNAINGATAASYTPPLSDANTVGVHTYTRRAKDNTCNTTLTESVGSWVLTVICPFDAGAIVTAGQTLMVGGTPITINSEQNATSNGTVSYQWYKNDIAISGATEAYYTPPLIDATVVGATTYTRRAKDNTCNTTLTLSVGSWVLTIICPFNAGAIATVGQTICSGSAVNTITSSTNASSGKGSITYEWRRNGMAIGAANAAAYNPSAYNTTVGAHTFTRWAKDGVCATDWTESAGQWVLTVNGTPTITLLSGSANQTKKPGEAIEVIKYTTANASGASITGQPSGISGSWNANTYTIDGTISADAVVQIYSYMATTSNSYGCTNATASGQIIMSNIPTSTGGPNTAYSTTTWIIGAQTWTDRIIIPACNKNDLSSSSITPDCRSYNDSGMLRYYYNWPYVNANASALCPSPWRVPTQSDFNALVSNTNDSAMIGAWGYGGLTQGSSMSSVSSAAYYWSSTAGGTYGAYYLRYASDYLYVQNYVKNFGYQVRCVR